MYGIRNSTYPNAKPCGTLNNNSPILSTYLSDKESINTSAAFHFVGKISSAKNKVECYKFTQVTKYT